MFNTARTQKFPEPEKNQVVPVVAKTNSTISGNCIDLNPQ
jgi:hypothetical protein